MVKQIIPADHWETRKVFQKDGNNFLNISEFYYDTIQGEGINIGYPAAFLRLEGCTMNCSYCDSKEVWRHGTPFTFTELFELMNSTMIIPKLKAGQHLVITGGSPLKQQDKLIVFLNNFQSYYGFYPFVEVENECTIMPDPAFVSLVDCWNNSPKLVSSDIPAVIRYQQNVIRELAGYNNSWFKFVISNEGEWSEIDHFYTGIGLIRKDQVILMPEGATRAELELHREIVLRMCIMHGVRYSSREHITIWDKKVGV
jgi:organic radical activating enzyme